MPTRTITLRPENGLSSITAIDCGTSTPKLGGTLDVSAFPNLTSITCQSNGITKFQGYGPLTNLVTIELRDNAFGAAQGNFETLSNKPNLKILGFNAVVGDQYNNWTGTFPDLTANVNLELLQINNTSLSGSNLDLSMLTKLTVCSIHANLLSGNFPILPTGNNSKLVSINLGQTKITKFTGTPPLLTDHPFCVNFSYSRNDAVGSIQSLNIRPNLNTFSCRECMHTGDIPSFAGLTSIFSFNCSGQRGTTKLTGFAGGPVPATLGDFQAQNNQLTSAAVDAILAVFVTANRTSGTRTLNLGGSGNAAPTSTGVTKTTLAGTAFSRSGTTVTVNATTHGYVTGDWVTVTGITETAFQGTFSVTRINDNVFQYTTISSGTLTGSGTATLRKTSTGNTSGFRNYQALALVSRTGGPWTITINFPA